MMEECYKYAGNSSLKKRMTKIKNTLKKGPLNTGTDYELSMSEADSEEDLYDSFQNSTQETQ